ncbi:MAG: hypothetical protein GTN53_22930 [Candidatus Aminicenantes bacterium]|nr:hypothetical protein [Candidatus Aminicenantes bacterium]NIQ69358.1 hypothetical protein [Candidatus Aminicenantes bacterium]NIT25359.1 hypothetical protein [Candidatus Aminicenantes bacterium]
MNCKLCKCKITNGQDFIDFKTVNENGTQIILENRLCYPCFNKLVIEQVATVLIGELKEAFKKIDPAKIKF